jgi:malate permease and related proteins
MLIAAGVALGRASGAELVRGLPSGLARLAIGLIAGIVVAEGLSLQGITRAVVILETAMPIAFLWPIYAKESWPSFAASLLVGLAALPFLVTFVI